MLFWNFYSLIVCIGLFIISSLVFLKSFKESIVKIVNLSIVSSFLIGLIITVIALQNLTDISRLGNYLHFAIILNIYSTFITVVGIVIHRFIKK